MSDKNHLHRPCRQVFDSQLTQEQVQSDLINMAPVTGRESRPWNPYWYVYQLAGQHYLSDMQQQLLVMGQGMEDAAIRLAVLGYDVYGIDADASHIDWAREAARKHGVADRCSFKWMKPDKIKFDSQRFDVIVCLDMLKVTHLQQTAEQLHHILKPGGLAIFKHQVATVLESTTDDAALLTQDDLQILSQTFESMQVRRFTILSRLDHLIPRSNESTRSTLQKLDQKLLELCPPMAQLGATAVITCTRHAPSMTDGIQFAA